MGKFNFKNQEDFEEIKIKAEKFYKTIGEIYCPYFQEKIAFNAKGLRHLKFKSDQKARSRKDQYSRLRLLGFAPEVLRLSHTLQGIWSTRRFEDEKTNSRWERMMKEVIFYEFVAVLKNIRVRVIVKEVQGGEKRYFWSIIPFWGIDKTTRKRILYSGHPEYD